MKTQWPRSADEPGIYMAQTGDAWHGDRCRVLAVLGSSAQPWAGVMVTE